MDEASNATSKYLSPVFSRIYQPCSYCRDDEGEQVCPGDGEQTLYGGDGDDYLVPGNNWSTTVTYGENGNDTFIAPSSGSPGYGETMFYGGDGNDTVEVAAYGDVENPTTKELFEGNDGDDVIRGSHKGFY